ncbi:MAG: DUF4418 family protein, partial [Clostridia bacterium]|nr:DUF4418 family protein [Clostridia bacterium]
SLSADLTADEIPATGSHRRFVPLRESYIWEVFMKKQMIPAMILLVLSLMITIGSQSFLSPCVHEDGSFGPCHWAGQTLMGLGCVVGILAILSLCVQKARLGTYMSALPVCGLGILPPARSLIFVT